MMVNDLSRPRVSRETRRLLAAAALALVALWILARLRFPERPSSPNPVTPVLTQISPPMAFADLAADVQSVRRHLLPLVSEVAWPALADAGDASVFPAWPLDDGLAITLLSTSVAAAARDGIVAIDAPTGVAVIRITNTVTATAPLWRPDRIELPRYLFSITPAPSHPAVVPAYVSSLEPRHSPAWSTDVWSVAASSGLDAGAFIFTANGEWLGIATEEQEQRVIVPAEAILDNAARLRNRAGTPGGSPGFEVQSLSPSLARATGAATGVMITWVDPLGIAADALAAGDVIEQVNGEPVPTAFAWQVHSARLIAGAPAMLRVRHHGELRDVTITIPPVREAVPDVLGLTLARVEGGSRVIRVAPDTAADRAGVRAGDIVTLAGTEAAPSPAQVRRVFEMTGRNDVVLIGIARGTAHHMLGLTR